MFEVACGGADVLRAIKFVWKLLDVLLFLVPMGVIIFVSLDFAKNVIAGKEDDMKKNVGIVIKRIVFCVALFLVEPICRFAINQLGNADVDWAKCVDIAVTEKNFDEYEVDFGVDKYGNEPIIVDK